MKIANNSLATERSIGPSTATSSSKNRETGADSGSSVQDSAEVSDLARLAAKLQNLPAGRIEELRRDFRSGNYTVDPAKVSEKLVDSMLTE